MAHSTNMYSSLHNPKERAKVVLLGDEGVGKTSLARVMQGDTFDGSQRSTIGANFFQFDNFNLWDSAGQERYRCVVPLYTRDADVVLMCTDKATDFSDFSECLPPEAQILVVMTKRDLYEEIERDYINTSAKTGMGVDTLMETIDRLSQTVLRNKHRVKQLLEAPREEPRNCLC